MYVMHLQVLGRISHVIELSGKVCKEMRSWQQSSLFLLEFDVNLFFFFTKKRVNLVNKPKELQIRI